MAFQQLKLPTRDGFSFSLSFDPTLRFTADKRWVWGAAAGALRFEDERPACAPGAAATLGLGLFYATFLRGLVRLASIHGMLKNSLKHPSRQPVPARLGTALLRRRGRLV